MKFLFPLLALFACAAGFVTPVAKPTLQRGKFHGFACMIRGDTA
jgi:hypothetical protein